MYASFFGLTDQPFSHTPNLRHIYISASLQDVFTKLGKGIEEKSGILIVVGEPGTGKTTLAHALVEHVGNTTTTALILQPPFSLSDFFQYIFQDFGLELQPATTAQSFRRLRNFLAAPNTQKGPPLLVVDEAHQLSFELVDTIRQLTTLEATGVPLLQVVLIGQPDLQRRLKSPQLRAFRRHIAAASVLRPLSAAETRRYITHHVMRVGGNAQTIFRPGALRSIYQHTGGIPSRINTVCDRALMTACAAKHKSIDRRMVRLVVRDLTSRVRHRFGRVKFWLPAVAFLLGFIWANTSWTLREVPIYPKWVERLDSSLRHLPQSFNTRVAGVMTSWMTIRENSSSRSSSAPDTRQSEASTIIPDRELVIALQRGRPMTRAETRVAKIGAAAASEAPRQDEDETVQADISERQEELNLLKAKMDAVLAKYSYKKARLEINRLSAPQQQQLLQWLQSKLNAEFPSASEQMQNELDQLEQEHRQIQQESPPPTVQAPLPSWPASVEETPDTVAYGLPTVCSDRLQEAKTQFDQQSNKKNVWFHNLFECDECCAPLLNDIIDVHVEQVLAQPHEVILFDLGDHTLKAYYQQKLDALMSSFNPQRHQILLIGRASSSGSRGYNIALSGKRAGEIKDYIADNYKIEPSRIRYLYFGDDPPQLTLDSASLYGVRPTDLAVIDTNRTNSASNKVNQSVVVVIYQNS